MNPLITIAGILLPWAIGCVILHAARQLFDFRTSALLGYGFFLGSALMYLTLCAWQAFTHSAPFWPVALTLLAVGAAGLLLDRLIPRSRLNAASAHNDSTHAERPDYWMIGLLILTACHLGLIAVEALYRPVFPWDAWQTWVYQAKAWFYAGGPVALDEPALWAAGQGEHRYNMPGHHYPGLVSAQFYWAATAFGQWSETRAGWPTLLCAVALCLALWGQLRAAGAGLRGCAAACFMLLSLPLVATHLSLAGYADLWLAGFSGLGLIALLRGLAQQHLGQCLLGFCFLLLGLLAKHDAVIWLACGIALCCLIKHPRASFPAAGIAIAVCCTLWLTGLSYLTLPGFGVIGLRDDQLVLGPLGEWPLATQNVAPAYVKHLLLTESWNVLWYAVLANALWCMVSQRFGVWRAPILTICALIALSQTVLFGFTAAGAWALDGTAINRLLLHVAPVMIFLLVVSSSRLPGSASPGAAPVDNQTAAPAKTALHAIALPAGISALLVAIAATLWVNSKAAGGPTAIKRFDSENLQVVVGSTSVVNGEHVVTDYKNGGAVLTSRGAGFNADDLPLLQVRIRSDNRQGHTLFWRRAQNPAQTFTLQLPPSATITDLRNTPGWEGVISELGIVLRKGASGENRFHSLTLHAATPSRMWQMVASQWLQTTRFSQASINETNIGASAPLLPLPLLAGSWLFLTWGILGALARRGAKRAGTHPYPPATLFATVGLIGWLIMDARWLARSAEQAWATASHYREAEQPDALDMPTDADVVNLAGDVARLLGSAPKNIAISGRAEDMKFTLLRAKYALLPHAGYVHGGSFASMPTSAIEAVLVLALPGGGLRPLPEKFMGDSGWLYPALQSPVGVLYLTPAAE